MSAPLHHRDLRGHRLPETLAAIEGRNALICEAAERYFPGASDREIPHRAALLSSGPMAAHADRDDLSGAAPRTDRGAVVVFAQDQGRGAV
jgi:hypothetical protein